MGLKKIETITVGVGGLSAITFSSIPQSYKHLRLLGSLRDNRTGSVGDQCLLRFNGDTGANYRYTFGQFGSWTNSTTGTSLLGMITIPSSVNTANFFGQVDTFIADYSNTTLIKGAIAISGYGDGTTPLARIGQGTWNNTAGITSISLTPLTGTLFSQFSTLTLYGIR